MDAAYIDMLIEKLRQRNVQLSPGLSDGEVAAIESTYGFRFPPDLRFLLQYTLPVSDAPAGRSWVNWRDEPEHVIRRRLSWPAEGIYFDIEHSSFWMDHWGPRPARLADALDVARQHIEDAPTLIPICGHRYIPDEPPLAGNPVFSVYQTDIIHYGFDLASYFTNEFHVDADVLPHCHIPLPEWAARSPRPIRFWDDFLLL